MISLNEEKYPVEDVKRFDFIGTAFAGLDWFEVYNSKSDQFELINPTEDELQSLDLNEIGVIRYTNGQAFSEDKLKLKAEDESQLGIEAQHLEGLLPGKINLSTLHTEILNLDGGDSFTIVEEGDQADEPTGFDDVIDVG